MRARGRDRQRGSRREAGRGARAAGRQHAAPRIRRPGPASPRASGCRSRARPRSRSTSTRASRPTIPPRFAARSSDELYRHVDLPRDRARGLDGQATDLDGECARYERDIAAAGGLDLCVLGIGGNGHIAFNEPGSPFDSVTRVVDLAAETRAASAGSFGAGPVPGRALTMGVATILAARRCVLLAPAPRRPTWSRAPSSRRRRRRCPRRRCSCTRTRRSSSTRPPRLGWPEASMRCTGCGAEMRDDAAGCLGLYHELSVHTLSDRDPTFPHQLAVDAYAAQHAGAAPKPITTAFALIGLYLVNERGFTGRQAQRAHMFLGRRRQEWPRFSPPAASATSPSRTCSPPVTLAATKPCGGGRRPRGTPGATSTNRWPRWFAIASIDELRSGTMSARSPAMAERARRPHRLTSLCRRARRARPACLRPAQRARVRRRRLPSCGSRSSRSLRGCSAPIPSSRAARPSSASPACP